MPDDRDARIERLLDTYFDTRVGDLVRRVVATATPEELADDDAMAALRDHLLGRLRDRYVHADAGWNHEAELLVHVEWDHAVERERAFAAAFEDLE
jgi:hypothetical protein